MKRVVVFGNSDSGKSTMARALTKKYKLSHLDLDTIAWYSGQVGVRRDRNFIPDCLYYLNVKD